MTTLVLPRPVLQTSSKMRAQRGETLIRRDDPAGIGLHGQGFRQEPARAEATRRGMSEETLAGILDLKPEEFVTLFDRSPAK